jgi:small ligand-binding sensory domain FIST
MSFQFGHARAGDWREAAERCLQAIGDVAASANVGFLYFTDHFAADAEKLLAHLRDATGVAQWVGSVGIGVLATGIEYMDEPAVAVMLASLPEGEFHVFSGNARPPSAGALTASGAEAAHFAVVHGDPATDDMPALIEDMSGKVGSGFLVGGLSSSRGATCQIANEVLQGGLSGLLLSSGVAVTTRLTQGCTPLAAGATRGDLGIRHVVTDGERNIIVSLDGRPALDVFKEDIGEVLSRDLRRTAHFIHAAIPVPGSDTGDYTVRNLVGIDPRNKLIAIGAEVETGMPILFCKRDAQSAREDLERMLDSIAADTQGSPRGGLYYSCLGRGEHMFGAPSAELGMIRDRLGEFPLVGFFCNGEISHDRLYGYTGVLTLFL